MCVAKSTDFGSPWVNGNTHGVPVIHGFLPMGVGILPPTSMTGTDWTLRGENPWVWTWVDPRITHVQPYIPQFIAAGTHTQRVLSSPYHSAMRLSERSPQAFVKKNLIARRLIHTPHKNTCKKSVIPFLTYNMTLTRHTFSFPSECDVPYPPPLFLNPVSVPLTS